MDRFTYTRSVRPGGNFLSRGGRKPAKLCRDGDPSTESNRGPRSREVGLCRSDSFNRTVPRSYNLCSSVKHVPLFVQLELTCLA